MISAVYVERAVADHPRTRQILGRFTKVPHVQVERYGEVFNRRDQNFRLQKNRPGLILADKPKGHLQPVPEGYGIGGRHNYYFSHLLNCPYDCRYCFLQGMYASAHYVLFVDYEAFFAAAAAAASAHGGGSDGEITFFSGYDADSLALEGLTGFVEAAVPAFAGMPGAVLELRTKSASPGPLLSLDAHDRLVVAFSLTPPALGAEVEAGVPTLDRRLATLAKLAAHGWPIGLRFDPLLWHPAAEEHYAELFERVFAAVPRGRLHSVSLGAFRLPVGFFKKLEKLHPDSALIQAGPFQRHGGMVSYRLDLERRLVERCTELVRRHVDGDRFFPCPLPGADAERAHAG
ncbi:MAG: spore photoproduct lyase family protein [Acidobacteriota bacterium]